MEKEIKNLKLLEFPENKSYSQIYTFTLQVICSAQENTELIYNFELQIEEHFQRNWFKYWLRQGHKLVLDLWKLKYKAYLASTVIDNSVIEDQDNIYEKDCFKESENVVEGSYKTWQELFQKHTQEIYALEYPEFEYIFYQHYYIDLINSFQNNIQVSNTDKEIAGDFETITIDLSVQDQITEELEQLKLLGLPTRFGSQSRALVANAEKKKKRVRLLSDSSTDIKDNRDESEDEEVIVENFEDPTKQITMADESNEQKSHSLQNLKIKKSQKFKNNRKLKKIPAFILEDRALLKYWRKRFSLFSRFDEGIRLDRESWFSVTPERVAIHLAERLACDTLVDAFCGSGGNAIQFAKTCRRVIAIDIDPQKIEMAKHNAKIYNVAERIEFIVGDFFHFAERLKADVVFLSPPWGGPKYKKKEAYDVEKCLLPVGASDLVAHARRITENIALFLPRNSNLQQIIKIAGVGNRCEIEHNYLDTRLVGISALYGDTILEKQSKSNSE